MSEPGEADRESTIQGATAKVLRWSFIAVGGLLTALLLIVGVLMLLAIPIDLSVARERVETLASMALERPFRIEGSLTLFPTLPPALQVEGVRIGNTAGWPDSDLLKPQRARIRLAVLPLLFDKVQMDEITLEGLELKLETNSLEPTDKDVAFSTRAKIERLDYGYLARRIDPESTVAGLISLDVDVLTRGPGMATLMHDSNGHIDFAIWPEDIDASIFDLWATNLLFQILPLLDSGTASQINCLVARFQLEDGIMEPSAFLVDTTHVQATAKGEIDFKSRKVDFQLVPRSKRPQMFSAETPLQVQGYFSDFSVRVSPGSLLGTTVRIITSPVVVPFQWVFTKRPPRGR